MKLALALTLVLFLGGCLSPLALMGSLGGGGKGDGTNVNANTRSLAVRSLLSRLVRVVKKRSLGLVMPT